MKKNILLYVKCIAIMAMLICYSACRSTNYIPYYNLVNEADYYYNTSQFEKASRLYERAFRLEKPFGRDLYIAAKCAAFQKNRKKCLKYLKKSASEVGVFNHFLTRDSIIFAPIIKDNEDFQVLKASIEHLGEKKKLDENAAFLTDTLGKLLAIDQRSGYREITEDTTKARAMLAADNYVQAQLLQLIQDHDGYPGHRRIGADIHSVILVHVTDEKYEVFKKVFFKELQKGNLFPEDYARMIDRYAQRNAPDTCVLASFFSIKRYQPSHEEDIIKRRLELGLSIYFKGYRSGVFDKNELLPWVNDAMVQKYSLLEK